MKISAIIPVKTFGKAKTRLNLSPEKTQTLCQIMLKEVLGTLSKCDEISEILVVSRDEMALELSKQFGSIQIFDDKESGVNYAVSLADEYLTANGCDASIVFPQDIPLITAQDIGQLLRFHNSSDCVLVVPSRKFDGTNALFRKPTDLMKTHYDEDSYKIHLSVGKSHSKKTSLVLISRLMIDIDSYDDLQFLLEHNEKKSFCEKAKDLL